MMTSRKSRLGIASLVLVVLVGCQDSSGPQAVTAPSVVASPAAAPLTPAPAKTKASRGRAVQGQQPLPRPGA